MSEAWPLQKCVEIADLWKELLEPAEAGDERARDFLATFGPWARDELASRLKS